MSWAAFLVGLVGPMAARLLSSLGLTMIVMTGAVEGVSALRSTMLSSLQGLPLAALQLGGLLGVWPALGILLGAMTFCLTWASTKGFWAFAKA